MNEYQPIEGPVKVEDFNPLDQKIQGCPYPYYKAMRNSCPVYQAPQTGMFYVTKYDDIRDIKRNPQVFTSDMAVNDRVGVRQAAVDSAEILKKYGWAHVQVLQRTDPPAHNRWRQYIDRTFTASRVRELKPYIDQQVHSLIDNWIDQGECEFVNDYCIPLPCKVIADQLGLPSDKYLKLKEWSDAFLEPGSLMCTDERIVECAWIELEAQHFFYDVFEDRRKNPRNDIMSSLVNTHIEGEAPLSMHELQNLMHQLITGGNETTTSAISHALWNLIKNPEQMAKLWANPKLLNNFVEEALRFETPILGLFRMATEDTEIRGTKIPKGSTIFMAYGSANRDEEKFDNGEEMDIERKNAGAQIAFGAGAHFCPGAMLARQELRSTFAILMERVKDIDMARPLGEITHDPSIFLHQLTELPIKFTKR